MESCSDPWWARGQGCWERRRQSWSLGRTWIQDGNPNRIQPLSPLVHNIVLRSSITAMKTRRVRLWVMLCAGLLLARATAETLLLHADVAASNIASMTEQYEELPYPPRGPGEFVRTEISLPFVNHLVWGGRRDWHAGFNVTHDHQGYRVTGRCVYGHC